jgi:hypothetical protein
MKGGGVRAARLKGKGPRCVLKEEGYGTPALLPFTLYPFPFTVVMP